MGWFPGENDTFNTCRLRTNGFILLRIFELERSTSFNLYFDLALLTEAAWSLARDCQDGRPPGPPRVSSLTMFYNRYESVSDGLFCKHNIYCTC